MHPLPCPFGAISGLSRVPSIHSHSRSCKLHSVVCNFLYFNRFSKVCQSFLKISCKLPENTKFLNAVVDKDLQEAVLYYSVQDKILNVRIVSRYVKSSTGIEISDKLLREYSIQLPETKVSVREYKVLETGEKEYIAQFTYKNSEYFLSGIVNQAEFEKIIKNLHFF